MQGESVGEVGSEKEKIWGKLHKFTFIIVKNSYQVFQKGSHLGYLYPYSKVKALV